jgi:hypothetical protein
MNDASAFLELKVFDVFIPFPSAPLPTLATYRSLYLHVCVRDVPSMEGGWEGGSPFPLYYKMLKSFTVSVSDYNAMCQNFNIRSYISNKRVSNHNQSVMDTG